MRRIQIGLVFAAACGLAVGLSSPASANGGHFGVYGSHGFHGGGYYHSGKHFRGGRGFRRGRHYGRRGFRKGRGDAALIALGVIGGAILLNEIVEEDRRRDYENRRREDRRYRAYDPERDNYYYQRGETRNAARIDASSQDQNPYRPAPPRDDLELAGGDGVSFSVQRAFEACAVEARQAAHRDGQFIVTPATPTDIVQIGVDQVRISAALTASDQHGRQPLSLLTCEADAERITFLQLS